MIAAMRPLVLNAIISCVVPFSCLHLFDEDEATAVWDPIIAHKDDDECLQATWGAKASCAKSGNAKYHGTRKCISWAKDLQRCCPDTCGNAPLTKSACLKLEFYYDTRGKWQQVEGGCSSYPPDPVVVQQEHAEKVRQQEEREERLALEAHWNTLTYQSDPTTQWMLGAIAGNCNDACGSQHKVCDSHALKAFTYTEQSVKDLAAELGENCQGGFKEKSFRGKGLNPSVCKDSRCREEGVCFYGAHDKIKWPVEEFDSCTSGVKGIARFCPCKN